MDVCGIGSALVDVLVETSAASVEALGLINGSMQLMDLDASERIHAQVPGGIERSGGSCANTIAGLAALGSDCGFIGRVADDRLGKVFASGLADLGVGFSQDRAAGSAEGATGRCLILVTPDAERTMCTTLGVASHLGVDHLDADMIGAAAYTYLEGYLWDEPVAIAALRSAIEIAHAHRRKVALTLSDSFCVDRHRDEWIPLVRDDLDLVFGNASELCSLMGTTSLDAACEQIRRPGLMVTVTRGPKGAWTFDGEGPIVSVPAEPTRVVDTTGAGDLYAAGFLHGLVAGRDLEACARIGSILAAEVISHIGGRAEADLTALVAHV